MKETNARIVVSSSWRCNTLEQTKRYLEMNGCRFVSYIIDHIQRMYTIRGREIQEWLDDNHHKVEKYCIIDDDSDMLINQKPFFIQTKLNAGSNRIYSKRNDKNSQ